MNKVVILGRLTREPEVMYSQGEKPCAISRYTIAVNRRFKREGEPDADFIRCISFGKTAEFAEKYLHQGTKVCACGRIQTGSYTNKEGQRVYTTDVVVEEVEFTESKNASEGYNPAKPLPSPETDPNGFMSIPDGIDEELPFN